MKSAGARIWLCLVLAACGYLGVRIHQGLVWRTDLMALLPREQQDPILQNADDRVTRALSARIVILVGDPDRATARNAARTLQTALESSGLVTPAGAGFDSAGLKRLGQAYFPYRRGLLDDTDRQLLLQNRGKRIADRALSQVFGLVGMADAGLLRQDPFLLLPRFLTGLPLPLSRLALDDGMLTVATEGKVWVLVSGTLDAEPFALTVQKQLSAVLDRTLQPLRAADPDLEALRLGAVFFAQAGGQQAIDETSTIGLVSTLGTILLVLLVFRRLSPLWLSLLVIGVGVLMALAVSLLIFGELHVGAMLFGVTLIGVAVDYSLQYCSEVFAPDPPAPRQRLRNVRIGITLGAATTIIGYLVLLLAPFPGLHQIAAFSAIGLLAAWATVVLWLPALDRTPPLRHGGVLLSAAGRFLALWEDPAFRRPRTALLAVTVFTAGIGLLRFHADDDVRHMQSLSPVLVQQQQRIQHLVGNTRAGQFFLVQAPDDETALEREEALADRLRPLLGQALGGFQSPAGYVPSARRQRENRALVTDRLDAPLLARQRQRLGLGGPVVQPNDAGPVLTLAGLRQAAPEILSLLVLNDAKGDAIHVVTLDDVRRPDLLAQAAAPIAGVRFVDPAADYSLLLGKYRLRAILLLLVSAVLMVPLMMWRYGGRGGVAVMIPPLLALLLAIGFRSLAGAGFTFFDAMALVLILAIGVDYAVFCAETGGDRKRVTMLAVALAAGTAGLSFGLLALSRVAVVHAFGATMLTGILFAFLLAPMARAAQPVSADAGGHWASLEERGAYAGLRFVSLAYTLFGRRLCLVILWPVVLYFYVTGSSRRRASLDYLARIRAAQRRGPPGWRDGITHTMSFAEKALDTFVAWSDRGGARRIAVQNGEEIGRLIDGRTGGLLIVSHLGNAELSRTGIPPGLSDRLTVLLHTKHAAHYNRLMRSLNPDIAAKAIEVTELGPETAALLADRVQRGEWLAIAGDRVPIRSLGRVSRVPFLGAPAAFSHGPYILANLLRCPVYLLFCLRDGTGHIIHLEKFADRIDLPRNDRANALAEAAARYAARLESYCLRAPLQWYNYYDFWAPDDPGSPPQDAAAASRNVAPGPAASARASRPVIE